MREHPMTQKARRQFRESMQEGTPIRWLMINTPKIRTVAEAVLRFERHCLSYPDIAEKLGAKEVMTREMLCERQAVLSFKTKKEAVRFLSAWYNRSGTEMAYRYMNIKETAEQMEPETLKEEEAIFMAAESRKLYESAMHPMLAAIAESEEEQPVGGTSYAELALANIRKRISELEAKRDALIEEQQGRTGEIKEILEKLEKTNQIIYAFDTVAEECGKE